MVSRWLAIIHFHQTIVTYIRKYNNPIYLFNTIQTQGYAIIRKKRQSVHKLCIKSDDFWVAIARQIGIMKNTMAKNNEIENLKVPPHSLEAEQSVLGSLMLDKDAIIKIADLVKVEIFIRMTTILSMRKCWIFMKNENLWMF
jgi:hypothetical protein